MKQAPLGIYLHIPFCVRKCLYCDFLSAPADEQTKTEYVDCLLYTSWEAFSSPFVCRSCRAGTGLQEPLLKTMNFIGNAVFPCRILKM